MKATFKREEILPALKACCQVINHKSPFPIRRNTLISVGEGGLRLLSNDLDLEVHYRLSIGMGEIGLTTVNAKQFYDLVKSTEKGSILSIHEISGKLEVRTENFCSALDILKHQDFPDRLYLSEFRGSLEIDGKALSDLIHTTKASMAEMDVRYYLNSMLFDIDSNKGELGLVATDGHRLSRTAIVTKGGMSGQYILPRKAIVVLDKLLADRKPTAVRIEIFQGIILFHLGTEICLASRLIEGKYPDYKRIIPNPIISEATLMVNSLMAVSKRLEKLKKDCFMVVRMTFSSSSVTFSRLTYRQEKGEDGVKRMVKDEPLGKESVPCIFNGKDLFTMDLNITYLIDVLKTIKSSTVNIQFKSPIDALLIEDGKSLHVIMPVVS